MAYATAQQQREIARIVLTRVLVNISSILSATDSILAIASLPCAKAGCVKNQQVKNAAALINGKRQTEESFLDTLPIANSLNKNFIQQTFPLDPSSI